MNHENTKRKLNTDKLKQSHKKAHGNNIKTWVKVVLPGNTSDLPAKIVKWMFT